ncbi:YadA-like family protein [Variovorax boronicumulans]|uniref:YadA-like family protein n=1 Tax=Variovorax boronicumulans TaxID=436515 RepID=UPI00277E8E1C|nr:YadA-like family protein [Variovorax boronicumulans]MDQ0044267.1 autotransporter adhesin [Variovorax boronicumulans]
MSTGLSTAAGGISSLSTGLSSTNSNLINLGQTVNNIVENGTPYFHAKSTAADSVASGQESVAIGPRSVASGANSFAAGNGAKATADGAIAVGFGAQATGNNAIAIGTGALASGSQAFGANSRAGNGGAAFGDSADAGGTELSQAQGVSKGTAIGFGAVVQQSGGVALGSGSVASRPAGVLGYVPGNAPENQQAAIARTTGTQAAVSVGDASGGQFRQITGVAAGSADSDAANIAQLKAASSASQASSAQYETNPDGSINYNQITLGGGQAPGGTRISNVAPGILPNDAVNVEQLNQVRSQVGAVARIAYSGIAMATAMSSLPQAMTPGKSLVSLGTGTYSGYAAVAFGYSARSEDGKWIYKVNGAYAGQRFNLGVGVGYEW